MIRGTTPTHIFTLPFDVSFLKEVKIIYAQSEKQIFCKRLVDCTLEGTTITTTLTQEETFLFDCKKLVSIQIRVLTTAGQVLSTTVQNVSVEKCLDDEVLI